MASLKTRPTDANVEDFLEQIENDQRKADCYELLRLCSEVTGETAKIWGDNMVGFGKYHYKYKSGHEGEWFLTGFAPRKQNLTIYIMSGFTEHEDLLQELGKYKTSSSCLYIKKLEDVNRRTLKELVKRSVSETKERYS